MTTKEVAKLLKSSEVWIKQLIKKGVIPSYKIGGKRLFKKEEIERWIDSQKEARVATR
ncbi:MAG: helix-turn-helix domain-containing protein [bacterium]